MFVVLDRVLAFKWINWFADNEDTCEDWVFIH